MRRITLLLHRHGSYRASHGVDRDRGIEPNVTSIAFTRRGNSDERANFEGTLTALGVTFFVAVGEHGVLVVGGPFFKKGLVPGFVDFA